MEVIRNHLPALVVLVLVLECVRFVLGFQYIYASIGPGDGELRPGLYGGLLNTSNLGAGRDLFESGFSCMKYEDSSQSSWLKGLNILSTNIDPISETILVQTISESGPNHVTLGLGNLCGYALCEAWPLTSLLMDVESLNSKIGPIAYFDEEIYFVSHHQQASDDGNYIYDVIELRDVASCNTAFPMKGRTLDFDVCSSQVAVILNASIPNDQSFSYHPGNSMYKIMSSSSLLFFIQIFTISNEKITKVSLYEVSAYTKEPHMLYEEVVEESGRSPPASLLATSGGLGGSAFRDNRLCWTTLNRVHCAWWTSHGSGIEDIRTVLDSSDIAEFCGAGIVDRAWIVGDITLADTFHPFDQGRELFMYFSCLNMETGASGPTGLLRMTETNQKWLYPVTSGGQPIKAAGLFLQRQFSRYCPLSPPTPPGAGGGGGNGGPPTPPGNVGRALKSSFMVMAVGLLAQLLIYFYINYKHGTAFASSNLGHRDGPPPDIHL